MWWPGSKEASEAPAEGDDDETSEEIMEILSEEDAGAEGGGVSGDSGEAKEEDDEDDMELARLKDQFRQQEDLLGQLRGALRRNETKLQGKEQEVQVCPHLNEAARRSIGIFSRKVGTLRRSSLFPARRSTPLV